MSEHIYKSIELTGSSAEGIQPAIENAIARAAQSIDELRWFEVIDTRGHIENGRVAHWQVTLKVGFALNE